MNSNEVDERYRIAFENSPGAIIVSSEYGSWSHANQAALKLYNMTADNLYTGIKRMFEKVHSDEPYVQKMNDLIDGKIDSFSETKVSLLAGGEKWFKYDVARSQTSTGMTYIIAHITDISELMESKNQVEEMNAELTKLNSLMVNRELAMIELKDKVKRLEK